MPTAITLTDFEARVLRYLERSRDLGRIWVHPRTVAGAAQIRMVAVLRALDRLAALDLATYDRWQQGGTYAITELGGAELRRRAQLALEIA